MKKANNGTTSIRFSVKALEKIKGDCDKFGVSQIELLECLALQSEAGVQSALNENLALIRLEKRAEKDKMIEGKKKLKKVMQSLTPEQIEALLNIR